MKNAIIFIDFENIVKTLKKHAGTDTDNIDFFNKLKDNLKSELRITDIMVYVNFDDLDFKGNQSKAYIQRLGFSVVSRCNKGKNASDRELVIDALKIAYTNKNIETFVIISSDKDFISLYKTLRQEGKEVYSITFNIGNEDIIDNTVDKHLFIEDICDIKLKEVGDLVNVTTNDDIVDNIIDIKSIAKYKIEKSKELMKTFYDSWLWRDYVRNRTKIGLLGYIDVVNKNVFKDMNKTELMELFRIAYALEYVIIWKDIDGMYYLEEGANKNEAIK